MGLTITANEFEAELMSKPASLICSVEDRLEEFFVRSRCISQAQIWGETFLLSKLTRLVATASCVTLVETRLGKLAACASNKTTGSPSYRLGRQNTPID